MADMKNEGKGDQIKVAAGRPSERPQARGPELKGKAERAKGRIKEKLG